MINNIKVKDADLKEILLFNKIKDIRKVNILFGGNGVGKTTFLNALKDNLLELDLEKEIIIKSFRNSVDNPTVNKDKELHTRRELLKATNSKSYSEGQAILHHLLSFLNDIKNLETDKQIIVILDEIDSGLSAENINLILWFIKELTDIKNVQFFISTNHYHFIYTIKTVLNMYTGTYIKINSYEEYFNLLNEGIQILKKSKKRDFSFLEIY